MATTYINNNVKFHAFSKSPVSPDTTLGGAVNPSGHTITTSQVRAQDIPAFLNTFAGSRGDAITWLGKNYATPAHNDIAYYGGEFKAGFDTPKCLKYNGKTSTWEDFDLKYTDRANSVLRTTLKNADDKDVLAIHQDCSTVFVDGGNNAATNSNRWSLFVKKSDGSILDHFVASTDKIVAGMPSLGYNALVMLNNAAIDEGELDANYVGNTFAGIIHLNKQYANGDDAKFKVTCFEYIGDKLDTTLGNIREEIQDIVGVTMEGVVASVGTNDAATSAGIGVDSTTKTSPKITFTAGSVATGETKLVSGGAVKTYVDTTALAEGGSIAKAIADYVAENAKVSVNEVEAKKVTVASGSQTGDLVQIVVTNDKTKAEDGEIGIKLSAQIEAAQWDEATQSFKNPDAVLVAGVAQTVINNTIINQITEVVGDVGEGETPTIATAIKKGITDATLADADNAIASATGDAADKLVTAEQVKEYVDENAKVTLTAGTGISIPTGGTPGTSFEVSIASDYLVKASDVTAISDRVTTLETVTVPALEGTISGVSQTVADIQTSLSTGAIHSEIAAAKSAADAAMEEAQKKVASVTGPTTGLVTVTGDKDVTITVSDTIATKSDITTEINKLSAAGGAITTLSGKVSAIETSLATGGTTANAIADAKKAGTDAQTSVNTLSSTSLTYSTTADNVTLTLGGTVSSPKIQFAGVASTAALTALETKVDNFHKAGVSYKVLQTLPDPGVDYNGVIVLVPSIGGIDETTDEKEAITGSYVEWLCVNKGTEEAPSWDWEQIGTTAADLHGYVKNIHSNNEEYGHTSPVYASISSTGYLNLGIDSATSDKLGVSKMFTGNLSTAASTVTDTAVSVKSAQAMYGSLATLANSKVSDVVADYYLSLAGFSVNSDYIDKTRDIEVTVLSSNETLRSVVKQSSPNTVEGGIIYDAHGSKRVIATDKIVNGANLFASTNIVIWVDDLSNMTDGTAMFKNCTQLTTFIGDLSSLESADEMFYGCTLDAESLEILADTLPTVTSGTIDIGASTNATAEVIATIKGKKWTLKSNGTAL